MTDYFIEILNDGVLEEGDCLDEEDLGLLETAVSKTLSHQKTQSPVSLTVLLTDDSRIQALNREFLGVDKPTDVLSFPVGSSMPGVGEMPPYLGDIAISLPFAERQAEKSGHSVKVELQLLVVHGTLHLLGYEHVQPDEKRAMWGVQTAVLSLLDLNNIAPTEA